MASVLVDTSAIFALLNPEDDHHRKAVAVNEVLIRRKVALVLPNFLLAESHAIINKRLGAPSARAFLHAALQDYDIERVTLEDEWAAQAILQHPGKTAGVSYFDAVAAALAERLQIHEIFTFDRHFTLLGFKAAGA